MKKSEVERALQNYAKLAKLHGLDIDGAVVDHYKGAGFRIEVNGNPLFSAARFNLRTLYYMIMAAHETLLLSTSRHVILSTLEKYAEHPQNKEFTYGMRWNRSSANINGKAIQLLYSERETLPIQTLVEMLERVVRIHNIQMG